MQADTASQHQDQAPLSVRGMHRFLQVGGGRSQAQLHRPVGAGLRAAHAQHAVAVVREVGGMGAKGTPCGGHSLAVSRTSLEAGIGAATAAAGSRLRPQFNDGELREQAVHATDRAEVTAPEPLFKERGSDHSPCCDHQQQAAAQPGGVLQIPDLLPDQNQSKSCGQQR